jgi:hypothetical protein
MMLFM